MPHQLSLLVTLCLGSWLILLINNAVGADPIQDEIASQQVVAELPEMLEAQLDLVYFTANKRKLHLDHFRRRDQVGLSPAVVLVHGGGWMSGSKERFHALAHALAIRGYVAITVEYRLGDEAPYPAAISDCFAAMQYIDSNAQELKVDRHQLFAIGGSAGGHLVGLLAAARDVADFQPRLEAPVAPSWKLKAALVMAGPMDLTTGPIADKSRQRPEAAHTNRWLGGSIDEVPQRYRWASPITHFSRNTSPIFFFAGEFDQLAANAPARKKLHELGVPTGVQIYHHGKHGCWNLHPWFNAMVHDMDICMRSFAKSESLDVSWLTDDGHSGELLQSVDALEWTLPRATEKMFKTPRLNNPVTSAREVGTDRQISLRPEVDHWTLDLAPFNREVPLTIRLETVGMPRLASLPVICSERNGCISLPAHFANVYGELLRYEPQPHKNTIGYWANEEDSCDWRFYIDEPGTFEVRIWQGCGKNQGGSQVVAIVGEEEIPFQVIETGHFQRFLERSLGTVNIEHAGTHDFKLHVLEKAANAVMDVQLVELVRVSE